jgi:hypothetical protein
LFLLAVFLDAKKIDVNSRASLRSGVTIFSFMICSSVINSSQNEDSSISSRTMLSFATKLAFEWAKQQDL